MTNKSKVTPTGQKNFLSAKLPKTRLRVSSWKEAIPYSNFFEQNKIKVRKLGLVHQLLRLNYTKF